jgi:pimeloyl-ACP methyl ester carboxylesterase
MHCMKRKKYELFIILVMSFIASGCGGRKFSYPDPAMPLTDNAFVSRTSVIKIGSFEYTTDFGTITVPENRNKPASRLIHLPVVRFHARSAAPREPIFGLAGGPGQSNMNWTPIDSLMADHDFIMVGYRGVDGSSKLDCPEVEEALKSSDDPLKEESLKKLARAWEAVGQRFAAQGIDWNAYTIPQTVEDLEAVRCVLKYNRIDLLSESYGTRVAYLYGLMHSESIHRSVMVAVNPPGHCMWDPQTVDEQLKNYSRLWLKDSIMSARCPDLAGTMRRVLHTMPDKWFLFSINPGKVKVGTFGMLFHRKTAALVFDAYVAADEGDYSGLALLSMAYDYIIPSMGTWGDFASKAVTADMDSGRLVAYATENPDAILGSPMNDLCWKPLLYAHLPIQPISQELRTLRHSDVETLLLSGSVDFSDPPNVATQELLPYLRNGKQIILSEFGHVGDLRYLRQASTDRMITSYFNTGVADTSGVEYVPMNFQVGWGLPSIAKTTLITGAVLGAGLIAGLVWLASKLSN